AETITFQAGLTGTINLASTLSITDGVTIIGPGAAVVTVSGQGTVQPFSITNGGSILSVGISGLTVANGRTFGNGGGFFTDNEVVALNRVVVSNCTAAGSGGAIAV